jgi:hypothetical protein
MRTPKTIPAGWTLSLTRHRVERGHEHEVDEWMAMLNDRADECVATLDGERMAVEAIFRIRDDAGDWLYWFELHGEGGGVITGDHPIDRDHLLYAQRCKVPGHVAAEPLVLLLPDPVRDVVAQWMSKDEPT